MKQGSWNRGRRSGSGCITTQEDKIWHCMTYSRWLLLIIHHSSWSPPPRFIICEGLRSHFTTTTLRFTSPVEDEPNSLYVQKRYLWFCTHYASLKCWSEKVSHVDEMISNYHTRHIAKFLSVGSQYQNNVCTLSALSVQMRHICHIWETNKWQKMVTFYIKWRCCHPNLKPNWHFVSELHVLLCSLFSLAHLCLMDYYHTYAIILIFLRTDCFSRLKQLYLTQTFASKEH